MHTKMCFFLNFVKVNKQKYASYSQVNIHELNKSNDYLNDYLNWCLLSRNRFLFLNRKTIFSSKIWKQHIIKQQKYISLKNIFPPKNKNKLIY